jgi:hypothetical protein
MRLLRTCRAEVQGIFLVTGRTGWDRRPTVRADGKGLIGHAGEAPLRRCADRVGPAEALARVLPVGGPGQGRPQGMRLIVRQVQPSRRQFAKLTASSPFTTSITSPPPSRTPCASGSTGTSRPLPRTQLTSVWFGGLGVAAQAPRQVSVGRDGEGGPGATRVTSRITACGMRAHPLRLLGPLTVRERRIR